VIDHGSRNVTTAVWIRKIAHTHPPKFYVTCDECPGGEGFGNGKPNVAKNLLQDGFEIDAAMVAARQHKDWHETKRKAL
jgi:hypothetical protein